MTTISETVALHCTLTYAGELPFTNGETTQWTVTTGQNDMVASILRIGSSRIDPENNIAVINTETAQWKLVDHVRIRDVNLGTTTASDALNAAMMYLISR